MSERYSKLFSLPTNLYAEGAPVIVAAGTLLKDNQTGSVLAQLKLQSITDKVIKAAKVQITSFDTFGNPLKKTTEKEFLDLSVSRDKFFGAKTPAMLSGTSARSYSVRVIEVAFADNTAWKDNGGEWKPLTAQNVLEDELNDNELVKQYRLTFGEKCRFVPLREQGLWLCSCGGINREDEDACHVCRNKIETLQNVNFDALESKKQARLAEEARQKEEARIAAEKKKEEYARKAREAKIAAEKARKKRNKILAIVGAVATACIAIVILINSVIIPNGKYKEALTLMESGKYDEAISAFEALDGYRKSEEKISECKYDEAMTLMKSKKYTEAISAFEKLGGYSDSVEKITECENIIYSGKYEKALALKKAGKTAEAAIAFAKIGDYSDAKEQSLKLWEKCADRKTISAGEYHTVGLHPDGTVVATGSNKFGQCNVGDWNDIISIAAGGGHTVGLRSDGTVVATGEDYYGKCNVSGWKNIVAITVGHDHTVGLRSDGTVVATGGSWYGQCDVGDWNDIISIAAENYSTVGLRSDGTVVTTKLAHSSVGDWKSIVAIAGYSGFVGLRSDGTVVTERYGDNDSRKWKNIVAVSKGWYHTVGLRSNGTVVATGSNKYGECNVSDWKNIKLPQKAR